MPSYSLKLPDAHPAKQLVRTLLFLTVVYTPLISAGAFSEPLSEQLNGFEIGQSPLVPVTEIHHGGPPRDGIPSIDQPSFINAQAANYLHDTDRVLGIHINNIPKAYPISILNWHEIVNDGDTLISYCPLCGTGMAFKSEAANFGVSGLLYNSDMLLYDRKTRSLWSQILAKAISGERKGESLAMLAVNNTSWQHWRNLHPDTLVLSRNTGFKRDYSKSPYGNYATNNALYFPVSARSRRYHPKEKVTGIELNGIYKAYPFSELAKSRRGLNLQYASDVIIVKDKIADKSIEIHFHPQHQSATVRTRSGTTLPSLTSYWFAWYAFHPQTQIYTYTQK